MTMPRGNLYLHEWLSNCSFVDVTNLASNLGLNPTKRPF